MAIGSSLRVARRIRWPLSQLVLRSLTWVGQLMYPRHTRDWKDTIGRMTHERPQRKSVLLEFLATSRSMRRCSEGKAAIQIIVAFLGCRTSLDEPLLGACVPLRRTGRGRGGVDSQVVVDKLSCNHILATKHWYLRRLVEEGLLLPIHRLRCLARLETLLFIGPKVDDLGHSNLVKILSGMNELTCHGRSHWNL